MCVLGCDLKKIIMTPPPITQYFLIRRYDTFLNKWSSGMTHLLTHSQVNARMLTQRMTQISIRELQRNGAKYLNEEVVITRYNVPVAKLTPITVNELKAVTPSSDISGDGVSGFKLCRYPLCNNYAVEGSDFCINHG